MKHLTYWERERIEEMLIYKRRGREISRKLDRCHSVISRELGKYRMAYPHSPYNAHKAHILYESRLRGKRMKKLEQFPKLKKYIITRLKNDDLSPQMISGRLKAYEARHIGNNLSHETIYQFIYSREGRELDLPAHLHTRRGRRYSYLKRTKPLSIPDRFSIHLRPKNMNERKAIGHLESDHMIFPKNKNCLSVEVDRTSRYIILHKTADKSSEEKLNALFGTIDHLGEKNVKSVTFDNGTENFQHHKLKETYPLETYFCDPYCSWQKGTVENMNKWIRWYLPRGIKFDQISQDEIHKVQEKLNNKPRKCLNYLTPKELLLMRGAFNT